MPAATLDLDGEYIIEQGSYWETQLHLSGNIGQIFLNGQIREDYGAKVLAAFRFGPPIYDELTNKTAIVIFLPSTVTKKIPVPPPNKRWRYDIEARIESRDVTRLLQGGVNVSPQVTE